MSENIKKIMTLEYVKRYSTDIASYSGLILCIIIFTVVPPFFGENIWTGAKISTLISNVIVIGLMAVGAVFVYSLGSMDISIGKQVGLYATLMVFLGNLTGSLWTGIIASLLISLLIGIVNGASSELLRIHPIISALVFMMILTGSSSIIYSKLGTRNISLIDIDYSMFKSPWLMAAALLIEVLIISYLFNYTKYGKYARAIGANSISAKQSGINLVKYKIVSYVLMNMCVVVAALFRMGYTGSSSDSTGTGFEMNVMVSLILGGMPLSGGMKAKVSQAVVGVFTFSILDVGLPLIGVAPNQVFIIKAFIFLAVVMFTCRKPNGILPR